MENAAQERILTQARNLFFKKGPLRVTMDELALSCGISKKTLYIYFANKEELLHTILIGFRQKLVEQMNVVLGNKAIPLMERLKNVIGIIMNAWTDLGFAFLDDLKRLYPAFWKEIQENRQKDITNVIRAIIAEAREQGYLRSSISEQFIVRALLALIDNIFSFETMRELSMTFQDLFENTIMLLFGGLLTEDGEEVLIREETSHNIAN
ncbi:MAG: TetR/AcrR family transcriptional regulator [Spirochaetes bacterium]|nr:TetR/AcrR family transcriptional regulator [Spirochaetota bacterium]